MLQNACADTCLLKVPGRSGGTDSKGLLAISLRLEKMRRFVEERHVIYALMCGLFSRLTVDITVFMPPEEWVSPPNNLKHLNFDQ